MRLLDICYYSGSSIILSVTRHLDFSIFLGCHLLFRMMTFFCY